MDVTDNVHGVLYPSHFAFLRAGCHDRDGKAQEPVVFYPQLQSLRIHCKKPIAFGKARGEAVDEQRFVKLSRRCVLM